jgi:nuclear transport factor 2 (NTF2) superfamily protein
METALQKVQMEKDAWNSKHPPRGSLVCTVDTQWRNQADFINGREEVGDEAIPNRFPVLCYRKNFGSIRK